MARQLQGDALRLRGLARSLEAVSPLATVARGYSILTRANDGALVRSTTQVHDGDVLHARVDDGRLWLEFRDRGQAFDPTAHAAPALDADIGERGIGGLGVFLVQELAEVIAYQRLDGCNVLRVTLRLDAAHDMESQA